MVGLFGGLIFGALCIGLGIKGFRPEGLPFSSEQSITGTPAKIIGGICIALGAVSIVGVLLVTIFKW